MWDQDAKMTSRKREKRCCRECWGGVCSAFSEVPLCFFPFIECAIMSPTPTQLSYYYVYKKKCTHFFDRIFSNTTVFHSSLHYAQHWACLWEDISHFSSCIVGIGLGIIWNSSCILDLDGLMPLTYQDQWSLKILDPRHWIIIILNYI